MTHKTTQHWELAELLMRNVDSKGKYLPVSIAYICAELGKKRGNGPLKVTSIPVYIHELIKLYGAEIESIKEAPSRKRTHFRLKNTIVVRKHRANARIEVVSSTADVNTQPSEVVKVDTGGKNPTPKPIKGRSNAGETTSTTGRKKTSAATPKAGTAGRPKRTGEKDATKAPSRQKAKKAPPPVSPVAEGADEDDVRQHNNVVAIPDEPDYATDEEVSDIKDALGVSIEQDY